MKFSVVIKAIFAFLVFVVLPLGGPRYLPKGLQDQLQSTGFDTQSFAIETATIGLIVTVIILIKGIVDPTSVTYLIVSLVSSGLSLIFTLIVLGVGNISNLGLTSFKVVANQVEAYIKLDLRVFIWIMMGVVLFQMAQTYFEWCEAKIEQKIS
jgi:hypothetical protein